MDEISFDRRADRLAAAEIARLEAEKAKATEKPKDTVIVDQPTPVQKLQKVTKTTSTTAPPCPSNLEACPTAD